MAEGKEAAQAHKEAGNVAFKAKRFQEALDHYTKAVDADPTDPILYCNRAFAYIKTEGYGAAIADATKAIELDKNCVKGYYRRATAHLGLAHFNESLRDFKIVLRVHPNDPDAKKKCAEVDKIVQQQRFLAAIAVESKSERPLVEKIRETVERIVVEPSYDGPKLEGEITREFVLAVKDRFKEQKLIHRRYALEILVRAYDFFDKQPSLVDVSIPDSNKLTVCGDVHGQFYDLLNIFELNGLPSEENPYLFNGDFVDRGSFSIECIFLLLSFKLLYPRHFFLSRGNHETINMNKMYGFEGEAKSKYNAQMADFFTEVFNRLPLCHLIEGKVLTMHGGLFDEDGVKLEDIRAVDRKRQPPESGIMCGLLWSDPQPQSGRSMSKRGVGTQFGPDVTERFLADNNLKFIIRSHEVKDDGYEVHHDGKCITIFSAPNYCDSMGNKGAFITLTRDLEPKFTTFTAVPHPNVKPMQYASMFGSMFGI